MEGKTHTRLTVIPDERPSLTEWAKMFNVSSKYKEVKLVPDRHVFNMDIFKKNLANRDYLTTTK